MKAIIPAAGLGTRFLPETKTVPKELLPVLDKPVLQYVVEEALDAPACDEVIIVNSRSKALIEQYFSRDEELESLLVSRGKSKEAKACEHAGDLAVTFVYQDEPLGLGHAVHCAADNCSNESFYVLLGDVIVPEKTILRKMHEISETHGGASVIAVIKVAPEEVSRFGVIGGCCIEGESEQVGTVYRVDQMVEKPALEDAPTHLAIFGRYLLSSRVMELLAHTDAGVGGEIQLTDALIELLQHEEMYALVIDEEEGYDTGTIPNLIAANVALAKKDPRHRDAL